MDEFCHARLIAGGIATERQREKMFQVVQHPSVVL